MSQPAFWQDATKANRIAQELKELKSSVGRWQELSLIEQLANRKKVNQAFPDLLKRSKDVLKKWKNIESIVSANDEAQMVIDDGLIQAEEIVRRASEKFLQNPWNSNAGDIVDSIVEEVVESVE